MKKKDRVFMDEACKIALESTCFKRNVGAVIVNKKKIISKANNGGEPLYFHCKGQYGFGKCYWKYKACDYLKNIISQDHLNFRILKLQCRELCPSICAERKVILKVLFDKKKIQGSIMYCTTFPCIECAKFIREVGIKEICYMNDFDENCMFCQESLKILKEGKIKIRQVYARSEYKEIGKRTNYEYDSKT